MRDRHVDASAMAVDDKGEADRQLNALYDRAADGVRRRDAHLGESVLCADAMIFDAAGADIENGDQAERSLCWRIGRLAASQRRAELLCRVVDRTVEGNVAIDVGYCRIAVSQGRAVGELSISCWKFLLAAQRQWDGQWLIWRIAFSRAALAAFNAAPPAPDLKFDRF